MLRMKLSEHGSDASACDRFMAPGTERPPLGVIVRFAVWQTFVVEKRPSMKRLSTIPADEAVGVGAERAHVVLHDRTVAATALGREQVKVVVPTVRLALALVEALLAELLATLSAEEMLRVPRLLQGRHAFIEDGSVTVGTPGGEEVVVVGLTVRMSVPFEEVPRAQLLLTVGADKVFRVPRLAEGCDHLTHDRLVAGAAASLLGCVHSLSAHVCLKAAKHTI